MVNNAIMKEQIYIYSVLTYFFTLLIGIMSIIFGFTGMSKISYANDLIYNYMLFLTIYGIACSILYLPLFLSYVLHLFYGIETYNEIMWTHCNITFSVITFIHLVGSFCYNIIIMSGEEFMKSEMIVLMGFYVLSIVAFLFLFYDILIYKKCCKKNDEIHEQTLILPEDR